MMDKLNKALQIARKSGDKVIVVDSANPEAEAFVVMNLKDYEGIIAEKNEKNAPVGDLTEQQLIDKINRDIALWKSENPQEEIEEEELGIRDEKEKESDAVEENMYYYPDKELLRFYESLDDDEGGEEEDVVAPESERQQPREENKEEIPSKAEEESLFEKFAREEEKRKEKKGSGWEIPFEVKKNADEIQE